MFDKYLKRIIIILLVILIGCLLYYFLLPETSHFKASVLSEFSDKTQAYTKLNITGLIGLIVIIIAFFSELMDSTIGMGYGTILSPVLLLFGFEVHTVVAAILFTEMITGFTAAYFHNKEKNFKISSWKTRDFKISFLIVSMGMVGVIIASFVGVNLPAVIVKVYIAVLIIFLSIILISRLKFDFSWYKMFFFSLLGSFNKGISGGGFGPVITSGQIVSGSDPKHSVGCTDFAEGPICLAGFLVYLFAGTDVVDPNLIGALLIGGLPAAFLGPKITHELSSSKLRFYLGILALVLGVWLIIKVF